MISSFYVKLLTDKQTDKRRAKCDPFGGIKDIPAWRQQDRITTSCE